MEVSLEEWMNYIRNTYADKATESAASAVVWLDQLLLHLRRGCGKRELTKEQATNPGIPHPYPSNAMSASSFAAGVYR